MCIGVDKDDLIVRCAKDETDALLAKEGVREFDLSGGRPIEGLAAGRTRGNRNGRRLQRLARVRSRPGAATSEDREEIGRAPPQDPLKTAGMNFLSGTCRGQARSGVSLLRPHVAARVQGERGHVIPLRLVPQQRQKAQ